MTSEPGTAVNDQERELLAVTKGTNGSLVDKNANGVKLTSPAKNNDNPYGIPIDRGWAWVIVVACFGMHVLVVGGIKSFGVLFVELQDKYHVQAKELGIIQGMAFTLMMALGLPANMLAQRFNSRKVVFAGGLLTALGFILTAYMPHFSLLYITYGLITGFGFGLSYSPCVVMVGHHFRNRRSLANGLSVSGSGVGSFVLPNIMRVLLDKYDLSGCLLILGAIMLNVCMFALLIRPLTSYSKRGRSRHVTDDVSDKLRSNVRSKQELLKLMEGEVQNKQELLELVEGEKLVEENGNEFLSPEKLLVIDAAVISHSMKHMQVIDIEEVYMNHMTPARYASHGDLFMASLQNIPNEDVEEMNKRCVPCRRGSTQEPKKKTGPKQKLFNWSLLKNPIFLMYAISCSLANFGYPNIFFMLPAFAESNGQDRNNAALLVSIIGVTDLLGRLGLGWFSDLNLMPKRYGFMGCIGISAILNLVVPAMTSFEAMAAYAALYGFFGGAFWALIAVLLAEALGVEKLSSSYGLVAIFMSTSLLPGPAICGAIRDATDSWTYSFIFCGVMALIGSIIPIIEPIAKKYSSTKESKKVPP